MERDKQSILDIAEAQPTTERDRTNLYVRIQQMSVAERVNLARLGNKEVRGLLIREPTRSVQVAVLNNPRITEAEIERFASSRTIDDEVIRLILNNREWMKTYAIKVALVKNPRTPVKASMRLISHIRDRDLRDIMRSKNVPHALVVAAQKMLSSRQP